MAHLRQREQHHAISWLVGFGGWVFGWLGCQSLLFAQRLLLELHAWGLRSAACSEESQAHHARPCDMPAGKEGNPPGQLGSTSSEGIPLQDAAAVGR